MTKPKKIVRLAVIRKNDDQGCPFGLPIPDGCKMAGDMVDRMGSFDMLDPNSSDDDKKAIAQANIRLWAWSIMKTAQEPAICKYADKIFGNKDAVECSFGDTAAGEARTTLIASPFYSQIFSAIGMEGLYSIPIGYYADYNTSRNAYYGLYSLQGQKAEPELEKQAFEALISYIDTNKRYA